MAITSPIHTCRLRAVVEPAELLVAWLPINAIFRLDNTLNYYFLKILHDYINYNHNWISVLKIHIVENGRFPSSSQFIIHFSI